jgi:Protein of unknown function (DUF1573)
MKNSILSLFFLLSAVSADGQPKMNLKVTEHDFGVFKEEAGRQAFTFVVTNAGDHPLVIQNIVASCGCTTPDWTRSPIAPGEEGKITAVYDPANRPGQFHKTLTVYSNSVPSPVVLSLKGEVTGRIKTTQDYYPWQVGTLRFKGNSIAFPQVLNTEKRIRVLPLINTSGSPVKIEFEDVPPYIELKAIPEVLKAGKTGVIECVYYGSKVSKWGSVSDVVRLKLDGTVRSPELFIQAVLMEDFSKLTRAEIANAPVFKPAFMRIDLGLVDAGTEKEVEFTFRNEGKRDLIIRNIWSSCSCIKINDVNNKVIAPGDSGTVKLVFSTEKLTGRVSKSVYIFNNDPANPKVIFGVQALIGQKKQGK